MNIRALIAIGGVLLLGGCAKASADSPDPYRRFADEIEVKSGYYLADSGDSYFYVHDGMIELCNYDFYEQAQITCEPYRCEYDDPTEYEEFVRSTAEMNESLFEPSEFVVVEWSEKVTGGEPLVALITNATREEMETNTSGAYTGVELVDENTIDAGIYYPKYIYAGEELPE